MFVLQLYEDDIIQYVLWNNREIGFQFEKSLEKSKVAFRVHKRSNMKWMQTINIQNNAFLEKKFARSPIIGI